MISMEIAGCQAQSQTGKLKLVAFANLRDLPHTRIGIVAVVADSEIWELDELPSFVFLGDLPHFLMPVPIFSMFP
jgi:hypothetical protein